MIRCPHACTGLLVLALTASATAAPALSLPAEETCGEHGTSVVFAASPTEAARQALEEEKLVFVLHVSGNFETPEYT